CLIELRTRMWQILASRNRWLTRSALDAAARQFLVHRLSSSRAILFGRSGEDGNSFNASFCVSRARDRWLMTALATLTLIWHSARDCLTAAPDVMEDRAARRVPAAMWGPGLAAAMHHICLAWG